jgi:hypothetical protein
MKSVKLTKKYHQHRQALSKNSWINYRKLLGRLVKDLSFPMKDQLLGALRAQQVDRLLEIADSLSSQKYDDATQHFVGNQVAYLIKKYPFPSNLGSFDPKKAALEKFVSAELKCAQTNVNFKERTFKRSSTHSELHNMRCFISYVIGNKPPSLSSLYKVCDFGPGASIGVGGNATNLKRKIASDWSVTPSALAYGYAAFVHDWNLLKSFKGNEDASILGLDPEVLWARYKETCTIANYNKIAFVPKTTKVHRTIAVEPLINGYLQKGVDHLLRQFLKRIRIDLSDQSINQTMALWGSQSDHDPDGWVTIDLSSASDSIAKSLVADVLPPDWFYLLDQLRSQNYSLDGEIRPYEKFCSMGNGFCFPLETLLFVAAAHACDCGHPGRDFHVYGDDIIVRKSTANRLIDFLDDIGFTTNPDKTFLSGPFRESCGNDWYEGRDVRPFILDFALDSIPNLFKFLNLSRRSRVCELFFEDVRPFIMDLIPPQYRFLRPQKGPADTGIDAELDEFMQSRYAHWNSSLQRWGWYELLSTPIEDRGVKERAICSHDSATPRCICGWSVYVSS